MATIALNNVFVLLKFKINIIDLYYKVDVGNILKNIIIANSENNDK